MCASPDSDEFLILHSPAKVNLMLSVHDRRNDGFHALTSLVVALDFGDTLRVRLRSKGEDRLTCSNPEVPVGADNLIIKAASAFRRLLGRQHFFDFELEKHIPMGAGLGGGSSNAASALNAMNTLSGSPLSQAELMRLSAEVGSDCPFFIEARPAVMRGRGECIEPVDPEIASRLKGRPLALFHPGFGVETAWAYRKLASNGAKNYESEALAQARLDQYRKDGALHALLYNAFELPVGEKYLAIPTLLENLRYRNVACLMSGSGSCCFALLDATDINVAAIQSIVEDGWGDSVFWVETSIR